MFFTPVAVMVEPEIQDMSAAVVPEIHAMPAVDEPEVYDTLVLGEPEVPEVDRENSMKRKALALAVDDTPHGEQALFPAALDFEASGGLNREVLSSVSVPLREVLSKVTSHVYPCSSHHSFHNVNRIIIDLDTMVPSHFSNSETLWHLAKMVMDPSDQKPMPEEDNDANEVQIIEEMPPRQTPKKRRTRKTKGPVDVAFLRRSKRQNDGLQGFWHQGQGLPAEAEMTEPEDDLAADELPNPLPLAMIPLGGDGVVTMYAGSSSNPALDPAPHIPLDTVRAIGTDFLKMLPEEVSDARLLASDDNDE